MSYWLQNFDAETPGQVPDGWTKVQGHASYNILIGDALSYSSPNSCIMPNVPGGTFPSEFAYWKGVTLADDEPVTYFAYVSAVASGRIGIFTSKATGITSYVTSNLLARVYFERQLGVTYLRGYNGAVIVSSIGAGLINTPGWNKVVLVHHPLTGTFDIWLNDVQVASNFSNHNTSFLMPVSLVMSYRHLAATNAYAIDSVMTGTAPVRKANLWRY